MKLPALKAIPPREYVVAVPVILSFVAFILSMLALVSGHQKGILEDYAIIRLNTSMIGRPATGTAAQGKLGALVNSAAGDVAQKMGISDWYSIHVTNSCEGDFGTHARLVVKKCSSPSPTYRFNLTQALDHELSLGPLHTNLAQLNLPSSIQDKIDAVNDVLYTLFVLYALTLTSALAAVPAALAPALLPPRRRTALVLLNMGVASFGAFCAFLAGTLVTAAGALGASALNDAGSAFGVAARKGISIIVLTWATTALMGMLFAYWGGELLLGYLEKRRERRRMRTRTEAKLPC